MLLWHWVISEEIQRQILSERIFPSPERRGKMRETRIFLIGFLLYDKP